MNNRQLTIFRTVCEEGSMTKAAEKLYMTQPAVSQTIKELEQESGVCFLERYNRKVVPTESGRLLYQYACHILGLYHDLEQHLKVDYAAYYIAAARAYGMNCNWWFLK